MAPTETLRRYHIVSAYMQNQTDAEWEKLVRQVAKEPDSLSTDVLEALDGIADAAQEVIDNWESGDLAGAVCSLDAWITAAREISAKAKSEVK